MPWNIFIIIAQFKIKLNIILQSQNSLLKKLKIWFGKVVH